MIFGMVLAIFQGLAAIPAILGYLKEFAAAVTVWYISNSQNETLAQIADAAATSARAKTKEERDAALDKWRAALGRPRVS